MDLGTTLATWVSADAGEEYAEHAVQPTRPDGEHLASTTCRNVRGSPWARELPNMLFYYVFGTFKIAVIAQQIYARFVKGYYQRRRHDSATFG
jgi:aminoglycoside phosphotransferase (APT) family kinase protein